MAKRTLYGMAALACVALGSGLTLSAAAQVPDDPDLRTDTRDFYLPGYRTQQIFDVEQQPVLSASGQVTDYVDVPFVGGHALLGGERRTVDAKLSAVSKLCLDAAHGPDGDHLGFQELVPHKLYLLTGRQPRDGRRMVLAGATAYVGPESQTNGTFTCIADGKAVLAWVFREVR